MIASAIKPNGAAPLPWGPAPHIMHRPKIIYKAIKDIFTARATVITWHTDQELPLDPNGMRIEVQE